MSDNEDFEEQIRLEKLAKEEAAERKTKVDEDGTEYEWDNEKQAWFPRIDADFIAQYQLSYGRENGGTGDTKAPEVQQDYLTYEDFVKFYYGTYKAAFDIEHHLETGKVVDQVDQHAKAKKLLKEDGSVEMCEEAHKLYSEYCEQYYKAWETGNYHYFRKHYNYEPEEGEEADEEKKKQKKKKVDKRKKDEGWFVADSGTNTNVYVSGLPADTTFDEFSELMGKAGMIMFDPTTKKPKIKLYQEDGKNKGDGRCCYIKPESVDLAVQFLDNSDVRGHTIHVEKAHFSLKGAYDPAKRKKLSNKQKKKLKEQQEKLFDWRPDRSKFSRPKNEKTVVIKNMFDAKDFEADPTLINNIKEDLKSECNKFGEVKKVVIYDRNLEGVATVTFAEAAFADDCIKFMNNRWFAQRQISAVVWDGKTKYQVEETEEERQARLKKWDEYLEKGAESVTTDQCSSDCVDQFAK